jgi:hypothetical protein
MPPSSVNVDSILPHHIVVTYVNDGGGVDSRKLFKDESCASADELHLRADESGPSPKEVSLLADTSSAL